jgi:GNAT superfamily N-acetyltransferase
MQTSSIRTAITDDLPVLAHLWYEKMVMQQQTDQRLRLAPDGREKWIAALQGWLLEPSYAVFVCEADAAVIGYLIVRIQPNPPGLLPAQSGVIVEAAIDAHRYHGGVGRGLVEAARGWLRQQGVEQLLIDIPRRSAVEQAFWRALGAKEWIDRLWMTC